MSVGAIIYVIVVANVLQAVFRKNNEKIIKKFFMFYNPAGNRHFAKLVSDNLGLTYKIRGARIEKINSLFAYLEGDELCFISAEILSLSKIRLTRNNRVVVDRAAKVICDLLDYFKTIIFADFGKLTISVDDIDNYHDKQLVAHYGDKAFYINFEDCRFMDQLLPTKNYYNINKKG